MDCPYYARVHEPIARKFVKGYCQGCPASGMIVPSLKEEKSYCHPAEGYLNCPIYRSRLMSLPCSTPAHEMDIHAEEVIVCYT